ncbi:MAG: septum formation initiator family protein [Gaiellaceae bacterium]
MRRWLALAAVALVALLYYRPLHTYLQTRQTLSQRGAEVRSLRAEKQTLERRLEATGTNDALIRQARRLGLVRRGERLFIVKGIEAWQRARSTIRRHG